MNEASQCVVLSTGAKPYDIVLLHGARKVSSVLPPSFPPLFPWSRSIEEGEKKAGGQAGGVLTNANAIHPTHTPYIVQGAKALALASMLRGNGMIYLWEPYLRQHFQLRDAIRRGQAQVSQLVSHRTHISIYTCKERVTVWSVDAT